MMVKWSDGKGGSELMKSSSKNIIFIFIFLFFLILVVSTRLNTYWIELITFLFFSLPHLQTFIHSFIPKINSTIFFFRFCFSFIITKSHDEEEINRREYNFQIKHKNNFQLRVDSMYEIKTETARRDGKKKYRFHSAKVKKKSLLACAMP
jgi:hypothetical protein